MVTAPAFWVFVVIIGAIFLWGLWITLERLFTSGPSSSSSSSSSRSSSDRKSKKERKRQEQEQERQEQMQLRAKGTQAENHVRWREDAVVEEMGGAGTGAGNGRIGGGMVGAAGYYDEERNVGMQRQTQQGGRMEMPRVAARQI